jgi:hypothetical protein
VSLEAFRKLTWVLSRTERALKALPIVVPSRRHPMTAVWEASELRVLDILPAVVSDYNTTDVVSEIQSPKDIMSYLHSELKEF